MTSTAGFGRRAFLGLAAVAGASAAGLSLAADPSAAAPVAGSLWRLATFEGLRGQRFRVRGGGSLRLVEVVNSRQSGDAAEAFLLLFEPDRPRAGSLMTLHHQSLGTFALGLTAVGRRGRLQAVIDQRSARAQSKEP
ncbi:MAG: hypothetical protein JWO88_2839 [Frankiales bacterium]|nr:hypothetical protein [Frankiales bacterium]